MMLFFQIVIQVLFTAGLVMLTIAIFRAYHYCQSIPRDPLLLKAHKWWVYRSGIIILAGVLLVESLVRIGGRKWTGDYFLLHLVLDGMFAVTFLLSLFLTGERTPKIHRIISIICYGSYWGVWITGTVLLWFR
jgi:hypothetical protein